MEERTAGSIPDPPLLHIKHHPPPPPPPHAPLPSSATAHKSAAPRETYVIQVPKDQVYRVPPPQNAGIIRQYLKSDDQRKNKFRRRCRWWWVLLSLAFLASILATIIGVVYAVITAENPQFSLVRVVAKAPPSGRKSQPARFEISLKARNPNDRIGIWYEGHEAGTAIATLSLKKQSFATGKFPGRFYQEEKNTTVIRFPAVARKAAKLPREVHKSATDKNSTAKVVGMKLAVEVPIRMAVGSLRAWKMDVRVHCTFIVSRMATYGRVSSQDCRTTR